jgi:LacI family transcriptional regulator
MNEMVVVKDSIVAQAMDFICSHSRELIQVDDVAQAVCISRSVLDKRFSRALGRGVQKEIRRLRTEEIARMLTETDMSITQIALEMNYTGVENIGRYFKQEMGLSPIQYRKAHKCVTV